MYEVTYDNHISLHSFDFQGFSVLTMMPFIMSMSFEKSYHRILCNMDLLTDFSFFTAINMTYLKQKNKQTKSFIFGPIIAAAIKQEL